MSEKYYNKLPSFVHSNLIIRKWQLSYFILILATVTSIYVYSDVLTKTVFSITRVSSREQCRQGASVLFVIKSDPNNDERRNVLRQTLLEPTLVDHAGIAGVFFIKQDQKLDPFEASYEDIFIHKENHHLDYLSAVTRWIQDNCPKVKFVVHMNDSFWPHLHYLKHYLHIMDKRIFHIATKYPDEHPIVRLANATVAVYSREVFDNIRAAVIIHLTNKAKVHQDHQRMMPKVAVKDIRTYVTMEPDEDPDYFNIAAVFFYQYRFPLNTKALQLQWMTHLYNTTGVVYNNLYKLGDRKEMVLYYEL